MDLNEIKESLEQLATSASELCSLASRNMPVATKNAAEKLYVDITDLLRRFEEDDEPD